MSALRIGYVRGSTDDQDVTLDAQARQLTAYCDARLWDEPRLVIDQGKSGGSLKRPALLEAMDQLDASDDGVLMVTKLDRLSRKVAHLDQLVDRAKDNGWALVIIELGVDTTTPTGRLLFNITASVAQWELETIQARTRSSLAELKAQGVRLGRPSAIPEDVLVRIWNERAQQPPRSWRAIADGLNADGIPTARGAAAWKKGTVRGAWLTRQRDLQAEELRNAARDVDRVAG